MEPAGRASELAGRASESADRASAPAWRALDPVGKASERARRAFEVAAALGRAHLASSNIFFSMFFLSQVVSISISICDGFD